MPVCLHVVCGCFHFTTTELSSCNREHMVHSLEYLLSGSSQKYLPSPALEGLYCRLISGPAMRSVVIPFSGELLIVSLCVLIWRARASHLQNCTQLVSPTVSSGRGSGHVLRKDSAASFQCMISRHVRYTHFVLFNYFSFIEK